MSLNLLAAEALLIQRLKDTALDFAHVGNPSLLAGINDIGDLLPACIVVPGAATMTSKGGIAWPLMEDQEFDIAVIIAHEHTDSAVGRTETVAGKLLGDVMQALHGHRLGDGFANTIQYRGREAPVYRIGYAEFHIGFTVRADFKQPR